jgi:hypothetical protein
MSKIICNKFDVLKSLGTPTLDCEKNLNLPNSLKKAHWGKILNKHVEKHRHVNIIVKYIWMQRWNSISS